MDAFQTISAIVADLVGLAAIVGYLWPVVVGKETLREMILDRNFLGIKAPPTPQTKSLRRAILNILALVISLLLVVGSSAFLGRSILFPSHGGLYDECFTSTPTPSPAVTSSPTPSNPPSVLITAPAKGDKVPMQITVQGTAQNIPKDEELWLFITSSGTPGYFPQPGPIPIPNDGQWSTDGHFGGTNDTGLRFTLTPVLINQNDQVAHCVVAKYSQQPGPAYQSAPKTSGMQLMTPEVTVVRE